jgi:hypothetical protein
MSAAQALSAARAAGIHLEIEGDDLLLEASAPPPTAVLDALSRHKADVVRMLRSAKDDSSPECRHVFFHERATIAELDGGLPRSKAEAHAFEYCVVEWLNQHPAPSAPGRCARCGRAESPSAVVLPFGAEPGPHAWLHAECWTAWHQARRTKAAAALHVTLPRS